ncbi:MAG: hypothetical protein HOW97_03925 [Catenulispora sp.]|nr:hypothetical protein [Catenulispora sp.]
MSPESLADLDDGWSARMHSAVIREQEEAGSPEPEAEQEHDDTAEPPRLFLRLRDISRGAAASTGADPGWFSRGAVAESVQRPDDAGDLRGSHDPVEHDDLGEPLESRKASGDSDEADDSEDSQDSASDTPRGSEGSAA